MSEYVKCSYCKEEITADSDFCPHCGAIFIKENNVFCDEHLQQQAGGVCIICHKVCCNECGVEVNGRSLCTLHQEVEIQQDWAEISHSIEVPDAEIVRSVLESLGHTVQMQNSNSDAFVGGGGDFSPVWRSNLNKPVKVFVPIPEYLTAVKELEEWRSSQTDIGMDYA